MKQEAGQVTESGLEGGGRWWFGCLADGVHLVPAGHSVTDRKIINKLKINGLQNTFYTKFLTWI